jgi:hypothetical protein
MALIRRHSSFKGRPASPPGSGARTRASTDRCGILTVPAPAKVVPEITWPGMADRAPQRTTVGRVRASVFAMDGSAQLNLSNLVINLSARRRLLAAFSSSAHC